MLTQPSYREELIKVLAEEVFDKYRSLILVDLQDRIAAVLPEVSVTLGKHSGKTVHSPAYGPTDNVGVAGSLALSGELPPAEPVMRMLISGVLGDFRWKLNPAI